MLYITQFIVNEVLKMLQKTKQLMEEKRRSINSNENFETNQKLTNSYKKNENFVSLTENEICQKKMKKIGYKFTAKCG